MTGAGLLGQEITGPWCSAEPQPPAVGRAQNEVRAASHGPVGLGGAYALWSGMPAGAMGPGGYRGPEALSAVFACLRILSNAISQMPWPVLAMGEGSRKDPAPDHPLYTLLHEAPNPEMTAATARQMLVWDGLAQGTGYFYIDRHRAGRPRNLWPIAAWRVRPCRDERRRLVFDVAPDYEDGSPLGHAGGEVPLADMYRFMPHTTNGVVGVSVIRYYAARSLGIGHAAEQFGYRTLFGDARPGMVLEYDGELSETAQHRLQSGTARWAGGRNRAVPLILENGMTAKAFGITPEDAQYLETRKFTVEEISRWFGVPPHMIGHLVASTNNNVEQQGIEFGIHGVGPLAHRLVQEANTRLLTPRDRGWYTCELDVRSVERADAKTRGQWYKDMSQVGAIGSDEVRHREGMGPLPAQMGTRPLVPVNMTYLDLIGRAPGEGPGGGGFDPDPEGGPDNAPVVDPGTVDERARPADPGLDEVLEELVADSVEAVVARERRAIAGKAKKGAHAVRSWWPGWFAEHRAWGRAQVIAPLRAVAVAAGAGKDEALRVADEVAGGWMDERKGLEQQTAPVGDRCHREAEGLVGRVRAAVGGGGGRASGPSHQSCRPSHPSQPSNKGSEGGDG